MEKLIISGGTPLKGTVHISGSKNSALPIIAATLLTAEPCVIRGVPNLSDIETMVRILKFLGVERRYLLVDALLHRIAAERTGAESRGRTRRRRAAAR